MRKESLDPLGFLEEPETAAKNISFHIGADKRDREIDDIVTTTPVYIDQEYKNLHSNA